MQTMAVKYGLALGFRLEVEPEVVGPFLEKLREASGGILTTAIVLDAARPKSSPIHKLFEWDDSAAAEAYRREQAAYLIRAIVVRIEGQEDSEPIRAFVSVVEEGARRFTSTIRAMSDLELRKQLIQEALREIESWKSKYQRYKEFAGIISAIQKVKKSKKW